ncbi:MAG: AMP-binding protein [Streptosporangiales bacterium]|nr:AMP-binding protein [Streptosporangiales bacterium]
MTSTVARDRYWDVVETQPRERLRELQLQRLRRQLDYVGAHSDFYRAQWRDLGFEPGDVTALDDLAALPVVGKSDYVAALADAQPWGSFLAATPDDVRRVHFSSGTTGAPTPVCWTARDLDRWADLWARMAYSQGVRSHDVYQCLFGYPWFVGGLGGTAGFGRIGATVIPAGSGDTDRQLDTIVRYGTTSVTGTPSFVLHLADVAARNGRSLRDTAVRHIQVGGEPGGGLPATRAAIEQQWGARCYDGYGSLEFQPIAWECEEQAGAHLAEDFTYAEVLDPDSLEPVPDGSPGVLVLTHPDKQACPLVRWWTGDVVVLDRDTCTCGRTHARLAGGVLGRRGDMLVVRGVNVFPRAVEQLVRRTPHASGEYQIVLSERVTDPATGYLTGIELRVETDVPDPAAFAEQLTAAVRAELNVRCYVDVVAVGTLPRSTHKSKRVVREGAT